MNDHSQALLTRVDQHFASSIQSKMRTQNALSADIVRGITLMHSSLQRGGKILACGNGGSAADAQHFAAELVNRFERERPPLAGLALTTDSSVLTSIANDYNYDLVFEKQVRALGKKGDVLLAITTSGNSPCIIEAVRAAHEMGMHVLALTGKGGGKLTSHLGSEDIHLCVPSDHTARTQENHLLILHCLCDGIDHLLLS